MGHKVLDIIDKTMNAPDERAEVLKMCLTNSSTGDYQPVTVPMNTSTMKMSQMSISSSIVTGKKHVPGKAGGGWESSDDDEVPQNILNDSIISDEPKDIMVESAWYVQYLLKT